MLKSIESKRVFCRVLKFPESVKIFHQILKSPSPRKCFIDFWSPWLQKSVLKSPESKKKSFGMMFVCLTSSTYKQILIKLNMGIFWSYLSRFLNFTAVFKSLILIYIRFMLKKHLWDKQIKFRPLLIYKFFFSKTMINFHFFRHLPNWHFYWRIVLLGFYLYERVQYLIELNKNNKKQNFLFYCFKKF